MIIFKIIVCYYFLIIIIISIFIILIILIIFIPVKWLACYVDFPVQIVYSAPLLFLPFQTASSNSVATLQALSKMCHALPSAWPKLRRTSWRWCFLFVSISLAWFHMGQLFQRIFPRTSKLYMWRLDEPKLHATWQHLCSDLPFLSYLIVLDFSFADWSNSLYSAHW